MSEEQFKLPPGPPEVITRSSTCLCESVSLSVTGIDKSTVLCHCDNCKQRTGSAFMYNHRFLEAKVTFDKGGDSVREYGDSSTVTGATLYSHFCGRCGSPLYVTTSAVDGFVALTVGNLDGERRQPYSELFVQDKHAWIGEVASGKA